MSSSHSNGRGGSSNGNGQAIAVRARAAHARGIATSPEARLSTARGGAAPRRRGRFRFDRRSSGLLMHLTSLPSAHGSGDLGAEAMRFVDFLSAAGGRWWQMLPVNPPGPGGAPYSSYSTFAGSPLLVSLDRLYEQGLLRQSDVERELPSTSQVEFARMVRHRSTRLRRAFESFRKRRDLHDEFERFCAAERSWLDDFALFSAIKSAQGGVAWLKWPRDLRLRQPAAIAQIRRELHDEIAYHKFVQHQFHQQWTALKEYANEHGVGLIGDVPIFVAHDSADVWAHRELFQLKSSGEPSSVSGVPPDCFSETGQIWGHPQYDWGEHQRRGFDWWIARLGATLRLFDAIRIDHFLGFARCWCIPARQKTARRGKWMEVPGEAVFRAVRQRLGNVPIIAEDLGLLTPAAQRLRDRLRFPGMRVLQFAFDGEDDYHRPHRYPPRSVAYTGTHDNDTIVGWFNSLGNCAKRGQRSVVQQRALDCAGSSGKELHWDMIRAVMASSADTAIFPVQDILGLGTEARMNLPGTVDGNWGWRLLPGQLTRPLAKRLRRMNELYGRV